MLPICRDMGGPDDFRGFMPPTVDPASVDALIFVVDACRMQTDAAYCEQVRVCVCVCVCVYCEQAVRMLYMRPHTTIYVSSYYYICVLIPAHMRPFTTTYAFVYYYICVLIYQTSAYSWTHM